MTASGAYTLEEVLALQADGRVAPSGNVLIGWGDNNKQQVGAGIQWPESPTRSYVVTALSGPVKHLEAARTANGVSGYIASDGTFWNFGASTNFATGRSNSTSLPLGQVGSETTWKRFWSGDTWTLAQKEDGTLWSVGLGTNSRTGQGSTSNVSSFTKIGTNTYITAGAGFSHGIAVATDGSAWSWGDNTNGRTGLGLSSGATASPTRIGTDNDWVWCAAGTYSSVLKKANGTFWAAGQSDQFQYGNLNTTNATFFQFSPDDSWASVYPGTGGTVILKKDGTLWALGTKINSGTGTTGNLTALTEIGGGKTFVTACIANGGCYAIDTNGYFYHCGYNFGPYDLKILTGTRPLTYLAKVPINSKIAGGANVRVVLISLEP
jgi:alpha-tubulin suppressor-like RCC1 family protein